MKEFLQINLETCNESGYPFLNSQCWLPLQASHTQWVIVEQYTIL